VSLPHPQPIEIYNRSETISIRSIQLAVPIYDFIELLSADELVLELAELEFSPPGKPVTLL
jgi:hypothetical protein